MDNDKYSQTFSALGIPIQPLPSNYTPEEYGRKLLSMFQTERAVSYAASTDYLEIPQMASETSKEKNEEAACTRY